MIALIVVMGEDVLDAYESRLLDIEELFEGEDARRRDERMVEKESDWNREVRMVAMKERGVFLGDIGNDGGCWRTEA